MGRFILNFSKSYLKRYHLLGEQWVEHNAIRLASSTSDCSNLDHTGDGNLGKLIYRAKLTPRIRILKVVSLGSSVITTGAYGFAFWDKGFTTTIAISGLVFLPFILTPAIVSWFFRRYVNELYYNQNTGIYTIRHFGHLLGQVNHSFKKEEVIPGEVTDVTSVFKVHGKPYYVDEELLIDADSVSIYKKMLNY